MDSEILVLSAKSGRPQRAIRGHEALVSGVKFISGGSRIISTGWDNTTRLWDLESGGNETGVIKHNSEVKCLSVNPEISKGASGARDGEVKIFSLRTFKVIRNLLAHSFDVSSLAFTNDGTRLLTASWNGYLTIWDLASYEPLKDHRLARERIRSMTVSPDDSKAFLGLHSGCILQVNLEGPLNKIKLEGHSDVVSSLAIDRSGERLLSGSWDRTLRLWSVESGTEIDDEIIGTGVSSIAWAPKGNKFYSADFSGRLIVWTPA
jgi:WD40 repeat protein